MTDVSVAPEPAIDASGSDDRPTPVLERGARIALVVFVLVELAAIPVFLWGGNGHWFFLDDFDFVGTRSLGDPVDLLRPHYEHWTTLPIIAYRLIYSVFGINSYLPYQLLALASHLGVAALLRWVMRRAGVGPWIATLAAAIVVLFGTGNENVVWAFQITFTGALLFGLLQLIASGHDGPIDRRDWWGLLAGLAAIMCAGPGTVMVAVVGAALLLRWRWKAALFHTLPLAAVYGLWTIVFGESTPYGSVGPPGPGGLARYVWRGVSVAFDGIGQLDFVGWVLALVLVAGVLVAWRVAGTRQFLHDASAPLALAGGAIVFMGVSAWGRAQFYGAERATESRYLYLIAAMCAPLLAVAVHALVTRWPVVSPAAVLLLLVGLPGNVAAADDRGGMLRGGEKNYVLTLPTVDTAADAPDDARPNGIFLQDITIGWLREGVRDGKVPPPDETTPALQARARVSLALEQTTEIDRSSECAPLRRPVVVQLRRGDRIGIQGGGAVQVADATFDPPVVGGGFNPGLGGTLVVRATPPPLQFKPQDAKNPPILCGLPTGP